MALKFIINKAAYDALSDEMKSEYIAGDKDGEYNLDVTGLPTPEDTGPLKRALDAEKTKYKTLKGQHDELKTKLDGMPNIEELNANHEKQIGKYKAFTEKTLIDGTAMELATKVSSAPKLLAKDLRDRFAVDLTGDEPKLQIKGADGKVSDDMTLDKLRQEVVANPDYKNIIIASKGSGGGAPKNPTNKPGGGGAPAEGEQQQQPDLSKMAGADLAARIKARKEAAGAAQP